MKRKVTTVICADMLFIFFLCIAGTVEGIFSDIMYYSSFFLVTAFALYADKRSDAPSSYCVRLTLDKKHALSLIPIIPLTVGVIFVISLLTSLVLSLFGFKESVQLEGNIFRVLALHALLPALLEEMLFRYVPLRLLGGRSPAMAILLSALFFGLSHTDLFQIPDAIIAGIILAAIDVAYDSIIPSLAVHFINNVCAVFWIMYSDSLRFSIIYMTVLGMLFLVSLLFVVVKRKEYDPYFVKATVKGEGYKPGAELFLLIGLTLFIAVTALLF
jgi:membrane protease YdiL (CAAX protease family)